MFYTSRSRSSEHARNERALEIGLPNAMNRVWGPFFALRQYHGRSKPAPARLHGIARAPGAATSKNRRPLHGPLAQAVESLRRGCAPPPDIG